MGACEIEKVCMGVRVCMREREMEQVCVCVCGLSVCMRERQRDREIRCCRYVIENGFVPKCECVCVLECLGVHMGESDCERACEHVCLRVCYGECGSARMCIGC